MKKLSLKKGPARTPRVAYNSLNCLTGPEIAYAAKKGQPLRSESDHCQPGSKIIPTRDK